MARIGPEKLDRILDLREGGMSYARIASTVGGCSQGGVQYQCLINGVERPGPPIFAKPRKPRAGSTWRPFTPADDAAIAALELEGLNRTEIGRRLRRSHSAIRVRLLILARLEARREALGEAMGHAA